MTNSKIELVRTKFSAPYIRSGGLAATFPRGTSIVFSVHNTGTKPLLPALKILNGANANPNDHLLKYYEAAHSIPPGGKEDLTIFFYFRGTFSLVELYKKHPVVGQHVSITVL